MDKQQEAEPKKEEQPENGQPKMVVKEEVSVAVKESVEVAKEESPEESEKRHKAELKIYKKELKKYKKKLAKIEAYRLELKETFHKSQDIFEKQLSYISAGALGLSVGFIKHIVNPIKDSSHKWMLLSGWGLSDSHFTFKSDFAYDCGKECEKRCSGN